MIKSICGENELLTQLVWNIVGVDGQRCENKGAYFACDGGYHAWPELVAPYTNQIEGSRHSTRSANLESIRKGFECKFGIFKKGFIFKEPDRSSLSINY